MILLRQKLQDIILADLLSLVVEEIDNLSELACMDKRKQAFAFGKAPLIQIDGLVKSLFLTLLHFYGFSFSYF